MASLNMVGPFPLNEKEIDLQIRKGIPGNYAYGFLNKDDRFVVEYVGRSDHNLNERISHGIGHYKMFKFSYANDNKVHPDRPERTEYDCPICNIFDK